VTLDDRARQAAAGVRESVQSADLLLFEAGVPGARKTTRPDLRTRAFAFAGAFAVVVVFVGLALLPGRLFAPDESNVASEETPVTTEAVTALPRAEDGSPDSTTAVTEAPRPDPVISGDDLTPPSLAITFPSDGQEFTDDDQSITFRGTVEPGARVFARTADLDEADVDEFGNWSITLILQAGSQTARFYAVDESNNQSNDVMVTVSYTPPAPATTIAPDPPEDDPPEDGTSDEEQSTSQASPPAGAFSATAQYGSRSENPPSDVYFGAATPGDRIRVISAYGRAAGVAGDEGTWTIRVVFYGAPLDETFPVTVSNVTTGESVELEFTRAGIGG
jgi:hypothetical protein